MTANLTKTLGILTFLVVIGGGIVLSCFGIPSPQRDIHRDIPRERWVCFRPAEEPVHP